MALYTCYTNCGKWDFEAYNDKDAIRLALAFNKTESDNPHFVKEADVTCIRLY